eukprot:m.126484 g.126484  ORF g.126484 m.126484 type:complete len:138 (+) comp12994_c2_seq6:616-1029(+)
MSSSNEEDWRFAGMADFPVRNESHTIKSLRSPLEGGPFSSEFHRERGETTSVYSRSRELSTILSNEAELYTPFNHNRSNKTSRCLCLFVDKNEQHQNKNSTDHATYETSIRSQTALAQDGDKASNSCLLVLGHIHEI